MGSEKEKKNKKVTSTRDDSRVFYRGAFLIFLSLALSQLGMIEFRVEDDLLKYAREEGR